MNDTAAREISEKLEKLRLRIKNTSSVRFAAARRLRTDYRVAQLTVVILSLWAIVISYALASNMAKMFKLDIPILTGAGVILPVFIVVFSLLENGEAFLRSHQLEANARQLRELSDQLYTAAAVQGQDANELLVVYSEYSERYSDCLERTPVNHDDVDHYYRVYSLALDLGNLAIIQKTHAWRRLMLVRVSIYFKRALYIIFWFAPTAILLLR